MSSDALTWTTPNEDSLRAGYAAFLRETARRLEAACAGLKDEWLDQKPAEGLMSVRNLLLHCNKLIAVSSQKGVGVDTSGNDNSITDSTSIADISANLIAGIQRFLDQIAEKGLILPLEQYALKPINDLGHHAGQIAIFPRLFNEK